MAEKPKRRFGDRYDGYKCRNLPAFFGVIPHIMNTRVDSMVYFEETVNIDTLEKYIRQKRKSDIPNLTLLHVIIAASLRMLVEKPGLNRFVAGRNIYARNTYRVSLAVKKNMTDDGEETTITPEFEATNNLTEITEIINNAIVEAKYAEEDDETAAFAKALKFIPNWLVRFIVFSARNLDKIGLMPKAIYKASPFHSSMFITDVGSIGIGSIYHHLYEFGTTSAFIAMGKKKTSLVANEDGSFSKKKTISVKFVLDERICDGFYYASALKSFIRYLNKPELLEVSPTNIPKDPWI